MASQMTTKSRNITPWLQKSILPIFMVMAVSAWGIDSAMEERLSLRAVILKALENNNDIMIQEL